MSSSKKIKLTDHFKIASKPRDPFRNISNQQQQQQQLKLQQQQSSIPQLKAELPTLLEPPFKVQLSQSQPLSQSQLQFQPSQPPPPPQPPSPLKIIVEQEEKEDLQNNNSTTKQHKQQQQTTYRQPIHHNKYITPPGKKGTVVDFDKNNLSNIFWESHYAWDCFEYDRKQEIKFKIHREALSQLDNNNELTRLSPQRWAELVDWLVTIQIRYGLEHEPVFMAVKLADHYLAHKFVSQDQDILLFIVTILISAKFDERVPPLLISDLISQARKQFGVRFSKKQVVSLEIDLLNTLNFHIRYPLSYGFLRRFAMCTRSDIRTIHLARYILESSLMEYEMIDILDSKIAAGSLLLAFKMLHQTGAWNDTAEYYTGYNEKELYPLVKRLNELITVLSKKRTTIRQKYRHESFKEVARIPPLLNEQI
uniref:G2/mitotic-specific cyclin-B3 n=1 Tax=Aceria tosichella TaxID=561515 RepID=A0A6G1SEN1_9ACAR